MRVPPHGGWHHAMNRAPAGSGWLPSPAAAAGFVTLLARTRREFPVEIHAYCALPRHYHLLVRAEASALQAALTWLEEASGFDGDRPPRTIAVGFGRHLTGVSRYIHLNPVDAGLVWYPEQWPHSSFRAYLGDRRAPRFLTVEAVLGRFGAIGARHRYRAYVYAGLDPGTRDRDGRPSPALFPRGSAAADLAWRIEPVLALRGEAGAARARGDTAMRLDRLARSVVEAFSVPGDVLRSVHPGNAQARLARGAFVHAARAAGGHRLDHVAAYMGSGAPATAAAAAERFDRALASDPDLANRVRSVLSRLTSTVCSATPAPPRALSAAPCPLSGS